jgi:hypothetical protein
MSSSLKLRQFAIHYVDKSSQRLTYGPEVQVADALDPTIVAYMLNLVYRVWSAVDTGSTRSGRFGQSQGRPEQPLVAKSHLKNILHDRDDFLDCSRRLAQHLYEQAPTTASPGLLAVLKLARAGDNVPFVAILKIRHKNENFIRVLDEALTQLEVEHIQNMLLDEIQKGAIIPHPHRNDYDLKVIDRQAANDPARYFTQDFLGCITKKSDEHQVKRLLPELREYAAKRGLPFATEKLPGLVASLQTAGPAVTTDVITAAVQEQDIFGREFEPRDFKVFVRQDSALGPVDIPDTQFLRRGKTGRTARRLTYHFRDPEFRGVTISGPPHMLANILSVDGDQVSIRIDTTRDGFDISYD